MKVLEGKCVAEKICQSFEERINKLKTKPNIVIMGMVGNSASDAYIKQIEKNCNKYGFGICLNISNTEQEFIDDFEKCKNDKSVTGIMFQQPLPRKLSDLIDEIPANKDIEGIGIVNMGKLFLSKENTLIPCTGKAVMEIFNYYNIDLTGKNVVVVGRSNIVGKPLIPQLLSKNATLTICHSKTINLREETKRADIVIMAIGKPNFLKKEDIKEGSILIDVGTNFVNGKLVGDIDYEDIKEKASMCTPVPGGVGTVTNAVLIDNIIKSAENI